MTENKIGHSRAYLKDTKKRWSDGNNEIEQKQTVKRETSERKLGLADTKAFVSSEEKLDCCRLNPALGEQKNLTLGTLYPEWAQNLAREMKNGRAHANETKKE